MAVRLSVLKCYVWSTLLYGYETWSSSQEMMNNLDETEYWFLRRMLRIPWADRVSTCEVFHRADVGKGLIQDMIRRQIKFIGHVIRKDELEKSSANWICRRNT